LISSRISRRYAKALLSIGQEDGRYEQYGRNLNEFNSFCSSNQEFLQVVSNRLFPVEARKKVLEVVLEKSDFPEIVKNFLRLLLDKDRLVAIKEITDYHAKLTDELSNITRAEVIAAKPLKDEALTKLGKALKGLTAKEVRMEIREDESLIGGVLVKIGDTVLDGSVKAQLKGLKESLKRGEYN
jgi:F-type H+-transporting ATPase subunit delta